MKILATLLPCICRHLGAGLLVLALFPAAASAQSATNSAPVTAVAEPSLSVSPGGAVAQSAADDTLATDISPRPATGGLGIAVNLRAQSGAFYSGVLQQALGLSPDSPVKFGGIANFNGNWLASGGLEPNSVGGDFVFGLNADVDMEKLFHIPGAEFFTSFLEYQGTNSNGHAGSIQLYDSLGVPTEFRRLELYEMWWRQRLFDDKLIVKVGKINGTGEFNQVLIPVPISQANLQDWTISELLYAAVGLNPTLFGRLPSYPNTAWGVTVSLLPTNNFYISYGLFDGNAAHGVQTGMRVGPEINSYKFHIGEVGYAWRLSDQGKPGRFAAGVWGQTGVLATGNLTLEHSAVLTQGATGFYAFASQRLWYRDPSIDGRGLIGFLQFGYTNSLASVATRYVGAGLTALGLVPGRPGDAMSVGLAWSKLNPGQYAGAIFFPGVPSSFTATSLRQSELMLQADYKLNLSPGKLVLQGGYTAIPTPGYRPGIPWANIFTLQLVTIF